MRVHHLLGGLFIDQVQKRCQQGSQKASIYFGRGQPYSFLDRLKTYKETSFLCLLSDWQNRNSSDGHNGCQFFDAGLLPLLQALQVKSVQLGQHINRAQLHRSIDHSFGLCEQSKPKHRRKALLRGHHDGLLHLCAFLYCHLASLAVSSFPLWLQICQGYNWGNQTGQSSSSWRWQPQGLTRSSIWERLDYSSRLDIGGKPSNGVRDNRWNWKTVCWCGSLHSRRGPKEYQGKWQGQEQEQKKGQFTSQRDWVKQLASVDFFERQFEDALCRSKRIRSRMIHHYKIIHKLSFIFFRQLLRSWLLSYRLRLFWFWKSQ